MKKILVTGIAGSGKSTVSEKLKALGYPSYDIENIDGLFEMVNKNTGEPIKDFRHDDIEQVKQADWTCDVKKLKKLINSEKGDIAFFCGTASNISEISKLFDRVFVLRASLENTKHRLSSGRENKYGRTSEVQDWIFEWKDWWENKMQDEGAIIIDVDDTPEAVAKTILSKV